uniref:Sulfotransferase n=1 Tax=Leersia perrieri TaxID=77586 RepID=A0A0D9VFJ7_9ORYZ
MVGGGDSGGAAAETSHATGRWVVTLAGAALLDSFSESAMREWVIWATTSRRRRSLRCPRCRLRSRALFSAPAVALPSPAAVVALSPSARSPPTRIDQIVARGTTVYKECADDSLSWILALKDDKAFWEWVVLGDSMEVQQINIYVSRTSHGAGTYRTARNRKTRIRSIGRMCAFKPICSIYLANHAGVADYFNRRGVSAIFLFRRNLLHQFVSQLANKHDRYLKQLNGTHKAHANILASYKPKLNTTSLIQSLKQADDYTRGALENLSSINHITIYYEDLIRNRTKLLDVLDFLKVPRSKLVCRHVKIHTKPLPEQIDNWDEVPGKELAASVGDPDLLLLDESIDHFDFETIE